MTRKEQILQDIENLKEKMFFNEVADNFYYTDGRRDADLKQMQMLELELIKEKQNENL